MNLAIWLVDSLVVWLVWLLTTVFDINLGYSSNGHSWLLTIMDTVQHINMSAFDTASYLLMMHRINICNNMIHNNNDMNTNKDKHKKPKKKYICSFCSRSFSKGYNKEIHERIHLNSRPYPCTVCEKSFRRADHLKDHMYTHTSQKPYECQCGKGFSVLRAFSIHKLLYSTNSDFSCPICPSHRAFNKRSSLKTHILVHHKSIKPKQLNEIIEKVVDKRNLVCCSNEDGEVCSLDEYENSHESLPSPKSLVERKKVFSSFSIDFLLST